MKLLRKEQQALRLCLSAKTYSSVLTSPLALISRLRTFGAKLESVTFPPGHLTQIAVGGCGVPSTSVAESCDKYPLPPCTSLAGPYFSPNFNRTTAPTPRGFSSPPSNLTLSPTFPPTFSNNRV